VIALTLVLAVALASLGPPALPPEPVDDRARPQDPEADDPPDPAPPEQPPQARSSLPPGLQPVPFPLEQQRRSDAAPNTSSTTGALGPLEPAPSQPRQRSTRSIIDLRDPFDRPPPRPRTRGEREGTRMLLPDLKDPFAHGVRRVRSSTLERYVPNDIRDPFRPRPRTDNPRPPCSKTTDDGTVVQAPGNDTVKLPECKQSELDLRDPFTREAGS
jgi:hypothetical protein